jgi:hypothetical protein
MDSKKHVVNPVTRSIIVAAISTILLAGTPPPPAIDQRCTSTYKAESYDAASTFCEQAASLHDKTAAKLSGFNADREYMLGATLRMLAGIANWTENRDSLGFKEVEAAISVFRRIASGSGELASEAKSSLQDAEDQYSQMKAHP